MCKSYELITFATSMHFITTVMYCNKLNQFHNDMCPIVILNLYNAFPQLWISRIAAASREHGMKYPVLMNNLVKVSWPKLFLTTLSHFQVDLCHFCAE